MRTKLLLNPSADEHLYKLRVKTHRATRKVHFHDNSVAQDVDPLTSNVSHKIDSFIDTTIASMTNNVSNSFNKTTLRHLISMLNSP